jgi:eukaryotic-like serine/threonine-protein kinase
VTTAAGFQIGDVIAGKYRIDDILGAGGMGIVVAARHLLLDDVVAIKFLSAELASDANAVGRFDREARAAARIKSEHIARVFDVDRLPNGVPYMVMEYLQGSDLAQVIDSGELLPEPLLATVLVHACTGLAEAHRAGIVHRDIKPSNLFCVGRLDRAFTIKVLDFGISKLTLTSDSVKVAITGTGAAIGSPAYMSPEQMRSSADVDSLTDIWSLGVVLYELATGKLPFNGTSFPELCLKIAGEAPPSPRVHRPDLSPRLEAIILKCLDKEPKRRFATTRELAEALLPLAPGMAHLVERMHVMTGSQAARGFVAPAVQVSTLPLATPAPPAKNPTTDATWTSTDLPPRAIWRPKMRGIGAGVGLGLVLSFGGIWWVRARHASVQAAAASASVQTLAAAVPVPSISSAPPPPPLSASASPEAAASASASAARPPSKAEVRGAPMPQAAPKPVPAPSPVNPSSPPSRRSNDAVWNQRN